MKVITTHFNADFDALSSMVAAKKLYPDAVLVFPGSQEKTVRDFLIHSTLYFLNIAKIKDVDPDKVDTLILVDTKQKGRIGEFAKLLEDGKLKVHVYDHHPPAKDDVKGDVNVQGTSGACVSMLVAILKERGIDISPEEATIMMLGIYEETGSFQYPSTTQADFEAASFLLSKGAHVDVVSDILVKELSPEQVHVLHDLIEAATVNNINGIDVVITEGSTEDYVGDLAILVQKFRDMENLNAVFALFRMDDRIYIIGRSRIPEVDVGRILSLMGGGGHKEAASATIKDITAVEARTKLLEHLSRNVKPLWEAKDIMFFPVVSVSQDAPISEARSILTKYNINSLPVTWGDQVTGIITRQITEKAVFHKLEELPVREYMVTDFSAVSPTDSIERVKEIVIGGNQRFLPVTRKGKLIGAITRTDLLRVLEDEIRKSILGKLDYHDIYEKRKNVKRLMEERISIDILGRLVTIGGIADEMGFHAYLVGGFVRDLLLRYENFDIDIVVEGDGIRFAEEMAKRLNVKIRVHKQFGTAKVLYRDGFKVDVATARLEYYKAPATLPIVEHSSLKLDLYRRDFTINTLAISLNRNTFGELVDFFGSQRDIKEKSIRVLHSLSFVEDPTRVFRAVRFEQRFGFQIGKFTMNLIKNAVKMSFLSRIKGLRIWRELSLMMMEEDPGAIMKRLQELDLIRFIYPSLTFDREKERLFKQMDTVLKWYILSYKGKYSRVFYYLLGLVDHMSLEDVGDLARRLSAAESVRRKLPQEVEKVREVMGKLSTAIRYMKKSEVFRQLENLSQEGRLFIMAKTQSEEVKKAVSNYITYADSLRPLVTGDDLKGMGVKEGPVFKDILDALKEAKIDRNLSAKEDELAFVRQYLSEKGIITGKSVIR
ncbi:MAG: Multifunctional CCA protein [Syntrophorhabdaceae bacterium PtaU1.Bin034]|nr:MAG: Multifunctional CCA protein [Syntrophorhabdaceae bacterium PtaU1.Bin034]